MPTAVSQDLSLRRRGAALASMLGASAIVAIESTHTWGIEWLGIAWAAMLAVGGLGITAKNVAAQTLSRGMAWLMAAPAALVLSLELSKGHHFDWWLLGLFAATASALFLSRPQLHTKDAHAQFHPHRFRKTLLAGSSATAATAFLTGGITLEIWGSHGLFHAPTLGFGFLTAVLLAVSTAVVRMRAWGILLGSATSIVLLAVAAMMRGGEGFALAFLSLPMLLLHLLPILWARWGTAGTGAGVRVGPPAIESAPVRYRVASLEDEIDAAVDADREYLPEERRKVHV